MTTPKRVPAVFGFGLMGVSIGALIGLSVSPVIGAVLAAILGLLASALAAAISVTDPAGESTLLKSNRLIIGPLVAFTGCLLLGAALGVTVRAHQWLEPSPDDLIKAWEGRGLDPHDVAQSLFEARFAGMAEKTEHVTQRERESTRKHGKEETGRKGASGVPYTAGGLFSTTVEECTALQSLVDSALIARAKTSNEPHIKAIANETNDPNLIKAVVILLCPVRPQ